MERQLAGLSTLVRSALVNQSGGIHNKDQSPDMMDLERRLLEMQSDAVERFGLSSATNSNASSMYSTAFNGKQLVQVCFLGLILMLEKNVESEKRLDLQLVSSR